MTVDLHSAVRTAVDEARRLAREASGDPWVTGTSMGYEYSRPGDVYAIAADGTPARIAVGTQCGPDISAEQSSGHIAYWNPSRALAMCDWADDVLARHAPFEATEYLRPGAVWSRDEATGVEVIADANGIVHETRCSACEMWTNDGGSNYEWPCRDALSVAAAFGVETGETP